MESDNQHESFFELQTELIQLALEFSSGNAADFFVYTSAEESMCSYNVFYGDRRGISRPGHVLGKSKQDVRAFLTKGALLVNSQN